MTHYTDDHHFHDGVFHAANRTNEASGRSFHIPAAPSRVRFWVWTYVQLLACLIPLVVLWKVLP